MIFEELLPILNELKNEFSLEKITLNRRIFVTLLSIAFNAKQTANIDLGSDGYDPVDNSSLTKFNTIAQFYRPESLSFSHETRQASDIRILFIDP